MSPDDVHSHKMPKLPDDEWLGADPALAAFAEDLRIVASGPAPEPRPGLVAVMAQGAVVPPEPSTGRPKMLVKSVLGSLAAKVALGVGVAAASVTAAGASGVLPDAAQHAVASVVSATTPFVLPDPSTSQTQVNGDLPGSTTTSSTSTTLAGGTGETTTTLGTGTGGTTGGTTGDDGDAGRPINHGACVSAVAQDKSGTDNHGKTVSSIARSDCGKTTTSSTVPGVTSSTSTTSTTVAGGNATSNTNSGKGNNGQGNSSGKGNSGQGNSGQGNGNSGKD